VFKDRDKRVAHRKLDISKLELMIAELEDMKTRHLSAYFKIKCNDAIKQLKLGQQKLMELKTRDS
jgi:hypothetical protein